MTRPFGRVPSLPLLTLALLAGAVVVLPEARAQRVVRFTEAELFFELNDTDGDLGIHASIDGEPWTALAIENLLEISVDRELRNQGLTQLSFESAEPSFDELAPPEFFRRFPEGRYRIEGRAQEGGRMEGTSMVSHVLAAPPGNILINRVRAAESCDDPLPTVVAPVLIDWDPVTRSHPRIGRQAPITVSEYQLFVNGDGVGLSVDLPPTVTQFEVPASVTALGGREFKFEIIARTSAGNNTAIESCFRLR